MHRQEQTPESQTKDDARGEVWGQQVLKTYHKQGVQTGSDAGGGILSRTLWSMPSSNVQITCIALPSIALGIQGCPSFYEITFSSVRLLQDPRTNITSVLPRLEFNTSLCCEKTLCITVSMRIT